MPKKRKLGQKHTPLARASITAFLNEVEFATQEEIGIHLENDVSLPLSKAQRRYVGFSTLRYPAFIRFKTMNVIGPDGYKRQKTLWRANPDYVDWRQEYEARS